MSPITKDHREDFDLGVFMVPKAVVERMDVDFTYNDGLDHLLESPEMIQKGRNKIIIGFDGYDDDPREVFDIFEIKDYIQSLTLKFPYWLYFCGKDEKDDTLRMIVLAHCNNNRNFGPGTVRINAAEFYGVCNMLAKHLAGFCIKYNLPKSEYQDQIKAVDDYFKKKTSLPS